MFSSNRLVLCVFQGYEQTLWVEEEVDDDVPEQAFQLLQTSYVPHSYTFSKTLYKHASFMHQSSPKCFQCYPPKLLKPMDPRRRY